MDSPHLWQECRLLQPFSPCWECLIAGLVRLSTGVSLGLFYQSSLSSEKLLVVSSARASSGGRLNMSGFLVVSRLLLAFVFVVSGLGKLADPAGSRKAMIDFGVPVSLVTPLESLLPLAELTIAGTLLSRACAWWVAVGALVMLLIFTVAIGVNLTLGRDPNCHCFGKLSSTCVGLQALIRNEMLAVVGGLVVWLGWNNIGPDINTWLAALTTKQWIGLITGLILLGFLSSIGEFFSSWNRQPFAGIRALQLRPVAPGLATAQHLASFPAIPEAGLPVATQAPTFDLPAPHSKSFTL